MKVHSISRESSTYILPGYVVFLECVATDMKCAGTLGNGPNIKGAGCTVELAIQAR